MADNADNKELYDNIAAIQAKEEANTPTNLKNVYKLISLLKEKQSLGVEITIVTWEPDSYGFGDASYWMQLHEEMRQAGFYLKFVEDTCEHFAIIDKEIVWYGNINLLAKEKIEDSMMRVKDDEIASELMEITFC